jgi:histone H3/H4
MKPVVTRNGLSLALGSDGAFLMNDWSFAQLCRLAGVAKDTINRLSVETAAQALTETLPLGKKPTQVLIHGETVRSIHGVNYERLWNVDLLSMVREFAVGFEPPPRAFNGGTGLYCGEQDMFCFLIDPQGWAEIDGETFAPGFFVWNSEVGRRTVGIQTFWFEQICQNHIVWDAVEVIEFTRKHTSSVENVLPEMRTLLERLVQKRDERRDSFVRVLKKAMQEKLGDDAEETVKVLVKNGIPVGLGKKAVELAHSEGKRFTVFSLVDALTRLARDIPFAGDRTEADQQASALLSLVA